MSTPIIAVLVVAAALLFQGGNQAHLPTGTPSSSFAHVDQELVSLRATVGGYPPRFLAGTSRESEATRLRNVIAELTSGIGREPESCEVLWRLGDAYRMAHNLDEPGSAETSLAVLQKALTNDPKCMRAHLTLGLLFVGANPKFAKDAERELKTALEQAGKEPLAAAHQGLVFAYVYQGRLKEAIDEADLYLKIEPDDVSMQQIRDTLRNHPERVTVGRN